MGGLGIAFNTNYNYYYYFFFFFFFYFLFLLLLRISYLTMVSHIALKEMVNFGLGLCPIQALDTCLYFNMFSTLMHWIQVVFENYITRKHLQHNSAWFLNWSFSSALDLIKNRLEDKLYKKWIWSLKVSFFFFFSILIINVYVYCQCWSFCTST